jgi:hypothetical protein
MPLYTPGGSGTVTSVAATDTSIVVGGTGAAPTIATATVDVIAADHPAAANWSNNSHKITSLANGSAASDAAAFGQIPATLDVVPAPVASVSLNSQKITSLLNGSGAQDAAAFGQVPVVESTIGNIKATGNTALGASSKWAAGDHVHAAGDWQPGDFSLIAWNFDPLRCAVNTSAVNGTIYMLRFLLRSAQTITNGCFFISTAATSATATQNYMALVDSGGTIRASTASGALDTPTQSGGWLSVAFSSPYAAAAGAYYLAILTNAGTPLKFGALSSQGVGQEIGVAASAYRQAANGTSATALPGSFTMASNTRTGAILVSVGVS